MRQELWAEIQKNKHCYLFISPFFILFGIFLLFPFFYSFVISLQSWMGFRCRSLLVLPTTSGSSVMSSLEVTLQHCLHLGLEYSAPTRLALLLAVALNSKVVRGRSVMQLVYHAHHCLSRCGGHRIFTALRLIYRADQLLYRASGSSTHTLDLQRSVEQDFGSSLDHLALDGIQHGDYAGGATGHPR